MKRLEVRDTDRWARAAWRIVEGRCRTHTGTLAALDFAVQAQRAHLQALNAARCKDEVALANARTACRAIYDAALAVQRGEAPALPPLSEPTTDDIERAVAARARELDVSVDKVRAVQAAKDAAQAAAQVASAANRAEECVLNRAYRERLTLVPRLARAMERRAEQHARAVSAEQVAESMAQRALRAMQTADSAIDQQHVMHATRRANRASALANRAAEILANTDRRMADMEQQATTMTPADLRQAAVQYLREEQAQRRANAQRAQQYACAAVYRTAARAPPPPTECIDDEWTRLIGPADDEHRGVKRRRDDDDQAPAPHKRHRR